ncbi:MAG: hypothetical protein NC913_04915 [Candidatus Omnitrophica bacterium]|nr:hypothetical protein [Candidatus Omnitrophota bacterium]
MVVSLYSSPEEFYLDHIENCKKNLWLILPIFTPVLKRILDFNDEKILQTSLEKMVAFHDLGKLTKKWQENKEKNLRPSHAPLGAAYLWKISPDVIKEPVCFAILIHHTDKGLLGDNIERPDVQAIIEGIVTYDGKINWDDNVCSLPNDLFPPEAKDLTINDLKDMAQKLRIWARSGSFLDQHKKRIQTMLCHHILKLCDISAAKERKEYEKKEDEDYFGGWLMVEEINNYVDQMCKRLPKCQ